MDAILAFRDQEPIQISVRVYSNSELLDLLENRKIDIALFPGLARPTSNRIEAYPICEEDICLFGPKTFLESDNPQEEVPEVTLVSPWNRSAAEDNVRVRQLLTRTNLQHSSVRFLPNVSTQILAIQREPLLAVMDARFGFLTELDGIGSCSLDIPSELMAYTPIGAEHAQAQKLIEYMHIRLAGSAE